jgi:hypothetical protein
MIAPNIEMLLEMRSSEIRNYAIPGVNSSLISTVRLFECSREHQEPITPHSHRFDFQCLVLSGMVRNRVWTNEIPIGTGDPFILSELRYSGIGPGTYDGAEELVIDNFDYKDRIYHPGDWYSMAAEEIHSIFFARNSKVLFFEGPTRTKISQILQPCVDGKVIPTFKVEPWMFERSASGGGNG